MAWTIEGTRHYGLGLSRFLSTHGQRMVEIDSSRHIGNRRSDRSDPIDAVRAAKELLARPEPAVPRVDGDREALRLLMIDCDNTVDSVRSARTVLTSLIVTASTGLREQLRHLSRERRGPGMRRAGRPARRGPLDPGSCMRPWPVSGRASSSWARSSTSLSPRSPRTWPRAWSPPSPVSGRSAWPRSSWSHAGRIRSEGSVHHAVGHRADPSVVGTDHRHCLNRLGDRQLNRAL